MAVNKITYGNETLIDLTNDTVTADTLETGKTAHNSNGEVITGTLVPVDLSHDTVTAATLSQGITAHDKDGNPITGTLIPVVDAVWG